VNLQNDYARLALAAVLGAAIGWERTIDGKPAGFRTYALVALGSAAIVVAAGTVSADMSRAIQGVVTGIGFLGAGSILRGERTIHGLTSAAAIWLASALGVLVGAGRVWLGIYLAVLTLVILRALKWVEDLWRNRSQRNATEA